MRVVPDTSCDWRRHVAAKGVEPRTEANAEHGMVADDSGALETNREAVELANNTVYGLAACVWSESINVSLHVAAQLKAGVVWVNCTNLFDASCGFGGYRESGYGREGGREGLREYLEPVWFKNAPKLTAEKSSEAFSGNGKGTASAVP